MIPLTLALSEAWSKSVAVLSIFRFMTSSITESDVFNFQRLSKFLSDPFFPDYLNVVTAVCRRISPNINVYNMSQCMRFPTMWYVRPAKPQISLRIRAV